MEEIFKLIKKCDLSDELKLMNSNEFAKLLQQKNSFIDFKEKDCATILGIDKKMIIHSHLTFNENSLTFTSDKGIKHTIKYIYLHINQTNLNDNKPGLGRLILFLLIFGSFRQNYDYILTNIIDNKTTEILQTFGFEKLSLTNCFDLPVNEIKQQFNVIYQLKDLFSGSKIIYIALLLNKMFNKICGEDEYIFDSNEFTWTIEFKEKWKLIRDEYLNYSKDNEIPLHKSINSIIADPDKLNKWNTLYLRAYGNDTDVCEKFPETMKLINKIPCTLANFSVLQPGAKIEKHVGLYKGILRYHLGLVIPKDYKNCFININDEKYFWKEGKNLIFDDVVDHSVENNTNEERIILFLDIKRDFKNIYYNAINNLFLEIIQNSKFINEIINNVNKLNK